MKVSIQTSRNCEIDDCYYVQVFNWIDHKGVLQVWNRLTNWKPEKEEIDIIGVWKIKCNHLWFNGVISKRGKVHIPVRECQKCKKFEYVKREKR